MYKGYDCEISPSSNSRLRHVQYESYRDTFKVYIKYLQEMFNISVENIDISDFSQDKVLLFLKYLEENRNNKSITLNNRFSVIHTFMKYVAEQAPEYSNIAKKRL